MREFWMGMVAGVAVTVGGSRVVPRVVTTLQAMPAEGKASYRTVLENERVRVREAVFPGGVPNTGMHTHQYAHVGVILTKGALLFTNPDGTTETVNFEPGSVGFREANATHAVGSAGPETMRVIEVELK